VFEKFPSSSEFEAGRICAADDKLDVIRHCAELVGCRDLSRVRMV
jgi:hypothetical protein